MGCSHSHSLSCSPADSPTSAAAASFSFSSLSAATQHNLPPHTGSPQLQSQSPACALPVPPSSSVPVSVPVSLSASVGRRAFARPSSLIVPSCDLSASDSDAVQPAFSVAVRVTSPANGAQRRVSPSPSPALPVSSALLAHYLHPSVPSSAPIAASASVSVSASVDVSRTRSVSVHSTPPDSPQPSPSVIPLSFGLNSLTVPNPSPFALPESSDADVASTRCATAPASPLVSHSNSPLISPCARPLDCSSPLTLSLRHSSSSNRRSLPSARYDFLDELGRGHFGKVIRVRDVFSGQLFACKVLDRQRLNKSQAVKHEIECLSKVGRHPNVVALVDRFEDDRKAYLVLELMESDLFSKIVNEGRYDESEARQAAKQIAEGLKHIHQCGVVHRDLKPENIMRSKDGRIAVADFGLSKILKPEESLMKTVCGSRAYLAPEVILRQPYTAAVDNWTLGVLLFILLAGFHPFDMYGDLAEPELLKRIVECKYDFQDAVWNGVSEDVKTLIKRLIVVDPAKRMSLDDFLSSPWIQSSSCNQPLNHVPERLQQYPLPGRLLRALVMAKIASKRFKASISRSASPSLNSRRIPYQNKD